jgi:hypothetical protein
MANEIKFNEALSEVALFLFLLCSEGNFFHRNQQKCHKNVSANKINIFFLWSVCEGKFDTGNKLKGIFSTVEFWGK